MSSPLNGPRETVVELRRQGKSWSEIVGNPVNLAQFAGALAGAAGVGGGVPALRAELEAQWRENHFEHCGRTWPHAGGERCMWPPPELLNRPPEAARPVPTEDEPG